MPANAPRLGFKGNATAGEAVGKIGWNAASQRCVLVDAEGGKRTDARAAGRSVGNGHRMTRQISDLCLAFETRERFSFLWLFSKSVVGGMFCSGTSLCCLRVRRNSCLKLRNDGRFRGRNAIHPLSPMLDVYATFLKKGADFGLMLPDDLG
jgi:hypothetical protein